MTNLEYGRSIENVSFYGWDNEFGNSVIRDVPSFNASKYLVSNEEFCSFVLDNGYKNKNYWTEEGWRWVITTNAQHPKFWIKTTKQIKEKGTNNSQIVAVWKYRTLLNEIDLPLNWPVTVNQLEAHAFTQWKSLKSGKNIRLPTEDELVALIVNDKDWKDSVLHANTDLQYCSSESPVDMFEFGETGFYDIVGNLWQHTLTPMHPFNKFKVHPLYDDYSIIGFDDKHNILRGGSWISSGTYSGKFGMTTRNWFRRHFFQFAGFRYVESNRDLSFLNELAVLYDKSNENNIINLNIHLHYCDEKIFGVANYAKSIADLAIKYMNTSMNNRALDIGCGTGRTSFELAREFDHVTGIDSITRPISVAYKLKEQGYLEWDVPYEGDIKEHYNVTLKQLGLNDTLTQKVLFAQNDAQNLDSQYSNYDLIVASNLIEELSNPLLFLTAIHERVNKNGKLILCSSYSWDKGKTSRDIWIGGKYDSSDGSGQKPIHTFDALKDILSGSFVFENEEELEMIQRETKRKYKHSQVHCTVWKQIN